jgi:hypothetical protein
MNRIKRQMEGYLRSVGIVYGIHFEAKPREKGIRIVLECIPAAKTMQLVETRLREIIEPVPVRPMPARARIAEPPTRRRRKGPACMPDLA